jgi:hypothetical protein
MANGKGSVWATIGVGVAIIVVAAAVLGSASLVNSQGKLEVKMTTIEKDVDANTEKTEGIDVMQRQLNTIERDVGRILDKLNK